MSKIKIIVLFSIILGFVGTKIAWAQFSTKVKFSNIRLKIGSFVLPKAPIWLSENDRVLNQNFLLRWKVEGNLNDFGEMTYQVELDGEIESLKSNELLISVAAMTEGKHSARVRACLNIVGCGDWSIDYSFLIDIKSPELLLNIDGYFVREAVDDKSWQLIGNSTYDHNIWKIFDHNIDAPPSLENYLELKLNNQPQLKILSFDYVLVGDSDWIDLDQPGFEVLINDQSVFWQESTSQKSGRALVDLSQFMSEELVIKIKAGQSGQSQSWLEVSNLTTDIIVLSGKEQLQLSVTDDFDQLPKTQLIWDENKVGYFGVDHASNSTDLVYKNFIMDNIGPTIKLIEVVDIVDANAKYYHFLISDDFGLKKWWFQDETTKIDLELLISGYEKEGFLGKKLDFWFVLSDSMNKYELIVEDVADNQTKFSF